VSGAEALTMNITGPLVPFAVVTVTFRTPKAADALITSVAVSDVGLVTLTDVAVTPVPLVATVVAPATKLVPVNVTGTLVP
jgi:hypothetical protein